MIFYFSGTGNSRWVAIQLAEKFNEKLIYIPDELKKQGNTFKYSLNAEENVFFVYPVHSWGPAALVVNFIRKIEFESYSGNPVYSICTCGDDCGYTDKIITEILSEKSIVLTAAYSVKMPNNYILMKGFGVDSKEKEKEKLLNAPCLLNDIVESIRSDNSRSYYKRGAFPFVKSRVVYPFFVKYSIGKNKFYVKDNCIFCGLCEEICPTETISLLSGKPVWDDDCVQCTACIHRCPENAIEYGSVTQKQGRYIHPDLR